MPAKVISIYSVKGGVGKSTIVYNLASMMAGRGLRVVVLDVDHQCQFGKVQEKGIELPFDVLPIAYTGAPPARALKSVENMYDVAIYDLPNAQDDRVKSAMSQSDLVLIPMVPLLMEYNAFPDHEPVMDSVETLFSYRPDTVVVMNNCDPNTKLLQQREVLEWMREECPYEILDVQLMRRKGVRATLVEGKSLYDVDEPKAVAEFNQLVEAVARRLELQLGPKPEEGRVGQGASEWPIGTEGHEAPEVLSA